MLYQKRQLIAFASITETNIPFVRNGGLHILPGLISLSFPGADGEAILHRMDLLGICISTGSACNSKDTEISHVLKAINLDEEYAKGTIRVSLGKYNTAEDVEKIVRGLEKILG
ncbi:MAG: aminotransferase class V-fold PLP-dependent enzyme [Lachnospiraceae bacterium]|nr:aminotransferase class V-fold PLP-dependent enzyme [Lachnospiraceae bacterium]